jgi:putative N6-adenine-specific DNA methylase
MEEQNLTDRECRPFSRRVRTKVTGPEHRFAIVVPRELAQTCLRETERIGISNAEKTEAGIEFTGKLKDAYNCHLQLRTASRLLCRIPPFRAGAAEELFYKVSQIPWELWINHEIPLEIQSRVEYSRISHEGKTADLVYQGIEKRFREKSAGSPTVARSPQEPEEDAAGLRTGDGLRQRILVHLIRNHCQLSLDMTGTHLHERGYRLEHAGAPLRETLAAAILLRAEWNGDIPIVDGMCGSGTFPIEAALIARQLPPGLGRDFLFMKWPSFQAKTWEYLCESAKKPALGRTREPVVGIDIDPGAICISQKNGLRAGVASDIEWKTMDFFDFNPRDMKKGLLTLNPPYGKRLAGGGKEFYERLGSHLRRNFNGWGYAVFAVSRSDAAAMNLGSMRFWNIRHGGIPVMVAMGNIRG